MLAGSASKTDMYETEVLEKVADSDAAVEFFACLDLQLNKVNQFYRAKEKEFLERGDSLLKQMEILTELKAAVKQQQRAKGTFPQDKEREEDSISGTISCGTKHLLKKIESLTRVVHYHLSNSLLFVTDDESIKYTDPGSENVSEELDKSSESPKSGEAERPMRMKKVKSVSNCVIKCQGKNLRIKIPLTNPARTFSAISYLLWDDLVNQPSKKCGPEGNKLHINKKKLHHAEKMIRGAFVELYKGLGYLKTYRNLNMLAFVKILKKFDKVSIRGQSSSSFTVSPFLSSPAEILLPFSQVTGKQVLPIYLRVVESSYFNSSDKV